MSKIIINNMDYYYSNYYNPIFKNVNLILDTDWRLGLIGRNGRGKTTFLRLLTGELQPDIGNIVKSVETEYFPYSTTSSYIKTMDIMKETIGNLKSIEDEMETIIEKNEENRLEEYQTIWMNYTETGGYEMESRIKKEFYLMNLSEDLLERDYELLSGGEKTKTLIISLFLRKNAFVLLDEPTNHLDLEGKRTLTEYLKHKKGFIVVSHDRQFLDVVTDHVLTINKADITLEKGNYSTWKENKDKKEVFEFRTKTRLEKEIINLEKRSVNNRNWAALAEKEKNPFASNNRGNSSRAAKFMRQAKASEAAIQNNISEKKNLLKNYEFTEELVVNQNLSDVLTLISMERLNFRYTQKNLLQDITLNINVGDRIWVRGSNGSGKSTLLKIIGKHLEAVNIKYKDNLLISESYQEPLWKSGFIEDFITDSLLRDKFTDLCGYLDVSLEVLKRPLETFSSGELNKIDIARALATENQLLLLDEPLNYMDIYFREQLEKAILTYRPTIVFVEHDERFGYNISNKIVDL